MSDQLTPVGAETLREQAVKRLRKQHEFRMHLLIYVAVTSFLVVVWWMTSTGFFWPVFIIFGWGIGVVANAFDAYGRETPTESQIGREMDRLRQR